MSNISFDNPWLLLAGIPLLLLVCIPFVLSVRRENRNLHNVLAFICHLLIAVAVTLGLAGMTYDAMITETEVYVLADVSHSSDLHLDVVDGYVRAVQKNLPKNTKMSLIAFGRNYQMLSDFDDELVSVREADQVDNSATDIAGALRYAGNLFDEDVIKRIVVITDGNDNVNSEKTIGTVNTLKEENVYIDVVYLDNNIADGVNEIQISSVEYTSSVFLNRTETAELTVNCNNTDPVRVYVDVECGGVTSSFAQTLYKGQNLISVPLSTAKVGTFEYTFSIRPEKKDADTSYYNNTCLATQTVFETVNVLYIGGSYEDCVAGQKIYGTENVRYVTDPDEVPFTVEDLCAYDEIVLCNFDVRTMLSSQQFVSSLDTVVSKFGKTLTTYGNTYVQETLTEENKVLENLGGMLPVTAGNPDQDARLVVLLMDISTSMNFNSRLEVARTTAAKLMESLNENDMVMILGYAGDIKVMWPASYLSNKEDVLNMISNYEPRNGTLLKDALQYAYDQISSQRFHHREMILLSDGLFHSDKEQDCIELAEQMSENNIVISALGIHLTNSTSSSFLRNLVENKNANGKGYYKEIHDESDVDYVLSSIAETMTEVKIEGDNYVLSLRRPQEEVLSGVNSLHAIQGFWFSSNKSGATSVLTATYYRDKIYSMEVPVYSYWNYGNGRVASFMSDIVGNWTQTWNSENEQRFLGNIRTAMLPQEKVESPFLITAETDGNTTHISVSTSSFRSGARLAVTLTDPMGNVLTKQLSFDSENYVCDFDTDSIGRYQLHLVYDYTTLHYEADRMFAISYYPEYDSFTPCYVASLYRIVSDNGEVSTDGQLKMDNSDSATRSYTFSFVVPLMIVCAIFFVLDVMIRLLRWKDIRSLFVHKQKRNVGER